MENVNDTLLPVHPGIILNEEFLEPSAITPHALAPAIRVPATRVYDLCAGKRGITADTALRLSRYFGTSAEFWTTFRRTTIFLLFRSGSNTCWTPSPR